MRKALMLFVLLYATNYAQEYKTIKIGSQVWMAENLNFKAKNGKCYDDKPENCEKYGRLYDWETAKMICPKGWHLPTNKEWKTLFSSLGGKNSFSALLGGTFLQGDYDESHVIFGSIGDYGCWFSASPGYSIGEIWFMSNGDARVKSLEYKEGCSVRCVKD
ncbi:MAG: hypothetical protein LBC64_07680 [Fibromonadaceae bacterium]|jgi:hypothetical protein|nr:hypothetical protein [Fibromonadaceae bacterium]